MGTYRRSVALAAIGVVALGVISRTVRLDLPLWNTQLGDALYAALFYLALSFARPALRVAPKAAAIAIYCGAIELFQLTAIPAALNRSAILPVRLFAYAVLGSGFSWWDLLAYALGIALAAAADARARRAGGM